MRRTILLGVAALACMLAGAIAFSVADHVSFWLACYWAATTGTTTGYGDVLPRSGSAHVIAVAVMFTAIPLLGATFASLTAMHVHRHNVRHQEQLDRERREDYSEGKGSQ